MSDDEGAVDEVDEGAVDEGAFDGEGGGAEDYDNVVEGEGEGGNCAQAVGISAIGCLAFPLALWLLMNNEISFVCTNKNILDARKNVQVADCKSATAGYIAFNCEVTNASRTQFTPGTFVPNLVEAFGEEKLPSFEGVAAQQKVEMYQCEEYTKSETSGSSKRERKRNKVTRVYHKPVWSMFKKKVPSRKLNSARENCPGYEDTPNPIPPAGIELGYTTKSSIVIEAGAYQLHDNLKSKLRPNKQVRFGGAVEHLSIARRLKTPTQFCELVKPSLVGTGCTCEEEDETNKNRGGKIRCLGKEVNGMRPSFDALIRPCSTRLSRSVCRNASDLGSCYPLPDDIDNLVNSGVCKKDGTKDDGPSTGPFVSQTNRCQTFYANSLPPHFVDTLPIKWSYELSSGTCECQDDDPSAPNDQCNGPGSASSPSCQVTTSITSFNKILKAEWDFSDYCCLDINGGTASNLIPECRKKSWTVNSLNSGITNCGQKFLNGCVRISYKKINPRSLSGIAESTSDGVLSDHKTKASWGCDKGTYSVLYAKSLSKSDLLDQAQDDNDTNVNFVRIFGTLMAWFGLFCIFYPLVAMAQECGGCLEMIPCIGDMMSGFVEGMVTCVVCMFSCSFGIASSLFVIALTWVYMRPLFGILLLAISVGLCAAALYGTQQFKKPKKQEKNTSEMEMGRSDSNRGEAEAEADG